MPDINDLPLMPDKPKKRFKFKNPFLKTTKLNLSKEIQTQIPDYAPHQRFKSKKQNILILILMVLSLISFCVFNAHNILNGSLSIIICAFGLYLKEKLWWIWGITAIIWFFWH